MKKIIALFIAIAMVISLSACSSSTTTTTTTTTTDASGNSTTTTTTTTTASYEEGTCGAAAQDGQTHEVSVSFENETGEDLFGLYCCVAGETEWSNLLDENEFLGDESLASDWCTLTYDANNLSYDFGLKNANDEVISFDDIDISSLSADGFTIVYTLEDGTYYLNSK